MPTQNRFTVYNASAGSGKTFQIALQYLTKILASEDRSYIYRLLGITFTNKAAEEMKKRIIDSLIQASQGDFSGVMQAVSEALRDKIGIKDEEEYRRELINRSRRRLFEILHHYDEFQLTTIDKLMYKIIRTFSRDMHLPADVGVEMDYEEIVANLIDKLINQAAKDSLLSKVLIDMSKRKIDDEKSWDIKADLENISKIIFDDNYFDEIKSLEDKNLEDFQKLKKLLYAKREELHKILVTKHAENLSDIIKNHGNNIHRNYKPRIDKFLSNPDEFHKIRVLSSKMLENIETKAKFFVNKYYSKQNLLDEDNLIREFFVDFHSFQFYYELYSSIINNLNSLSILNELNKEIEAFKAENNSIFIHDFNKLIAERLLEDLSSDTPYIFMRLGEKYAHFFIDEFQDTSALQWQNLIPLLKESLSKEFGNGEAGTSMIVGDAKQSIYRFRGGKPEQFIALSNPEDNTAEGNPFAAITGKKVENLAFNWRSQPNVIRFNNAFFSSFPDYLNETYRSVYEREKVEQKIPPGKDGDEGFVQIRFYTANASKDRGEREDFKEIVLENVLQARENGYRLDEICILVDRNKYGVDISELLINNGIEVVSSESLLVGSAAKVKLLLSIFKFLDSGKSADLYEAVRYVARQNQLDEPEVYARFFADKKLSKQQFIEQFAAYGYALDYDRMMQFNLYDLAVYLTDVFGLTGQSFEYAYLQAFLEKVYEYQTRHQAHLRGFLSQWKDIEGNFSINTPEKENAVRIMSVHKSKGLEFPVVIYYTQGKLFSSKDAENNTWIEVNPKEYAGFKYLPVQIKALEGSRIPRYREVYERVVSEKTFDNMNRLYVALTRAVDQLYVVVPYPPLGENTEVKSFSQVFNRFLKTTDYQVKENLYRYGNPKRRTPAGSFVSTGEYMEHLPYKLWYLQERNHVKINTRSFERWQESKRQAIAYGMQLHDILSRIQTREQWQRQKTKLLAGLPEEDRPLVEQLVEKLIDHPGLQAYFSEDYRVLNEQSILIPAGEAGFTQKRPDRLLFKDDEVVIIDYKTGEKHPYHRRQLEEYASLLEEAGYRSAEKILVYFDKDDIEVERF